MPTLSTQGIILHKYDYGEHDSIITFFTKDRGKKRAVAKGIKKITSRRAGHLDLLNRVSLLLHKGKLLTITQSSVLESFAEIKTDLGKLSWAILICELADKLVPEEEPEPHFYDLLLQTLRTLKITENPKAAARKFSYEALHLLGFLPERNHRGIKASSTLLQNTVSLFPNSEDVWNVLKRIH